MFFKWIKVQTCANVQMTRNSISFVTIEMQIKSIGDTTVHVVLKWLKLKRLIIPSIGKNEEVLGSPIHCWWECKGIHFWSGLPFPSPGDVLNQGVEPMSPALQADTVPTEPPEKHPPPRKKVTGTPTIWAITSKRKEVCDEPMICTHTFIYSGFVMVKL